eukprot:17838-Pelagomonas_calceolata.AAC.2
MDVARIWSLKELAGCLQFLEHLVQHMASQRAYLRPKHISLSRSDVRQAYASTQSCALTGVMVNAKQLSTRATAVETHTRALFMVLRRTAALSEDMGYECGLQYAAQVRDGRPPSIMKPNLLCLRGLSEA